MSTYFNTIMAATYDYIIKRFKELNALTPDSAVTIEQLELENSSYGSCKEQFNYLIKTNKIKQVSNRYYLDLNAINDSHKMLLYIALGLIAVSTTTLFIAFFLIK